MTLTIGDVAVILRSKNAGPYLLSIEAFFADYETFRAVRDANAVTRASVAAAYEVKPSDVRNVSWYENVYGVKCVIWPRYRADAPHCRDLYGAQGHGPFAQLTVEGEL